MQLIGGSILEAIDWTQDHLRTTRPLAERTLFAMMASKKVTETANGYVLVEENGEEEMEKRHNAVKNHPQVLRFHRARKFGHKHLRQFVKQQQFQRLDKPDDDDTDDDDTDETTDALS